MRFICALLLCLIGAEIALADGISAPLAVPSGYTSDAAFSYPPQTGGGGVTYAFQTGSSNPSCGFQLTCQVTGVTVPSGLIAISVSVDQSGTPLALAAVKVCGTTLTQAAFAISNFESEIWYGTTSGGSCAVEVDLASSGGIGYFYFGFGTVTGTSAPTGSPCAGTTSNTGGTGSVSCSSALTVASGHVALAAVSCQGQPNPTPLNNMTTDFSAGAGFGHSTTAGSLTPNGGSCNFSAASIAGVVF